jgi:tRNA 2-thiouridine synthesizing protein A
LVRERTGMKSDAQVDCVGLFCPMPIVNTAKKIREMQPGQVLEVIADDEGIKQDMPNWAKLTGNDYLGIEEENGRYHVFVRKS